ncbi:hypothetical protein AMR41_15030 [Hapalosiphon sp. MRB220]|nr:hypothetical protein AMR41_15030 [Hapalosiphon sp. MRB220]
MHCLNYHTYTKQYKILILFLQKLFLVVFYTNIFNAVWGFAQNPALKPRTAKQNYCAIAKGDRTQ